MGRPIQLEWQDEDSVERLKARYRAATRTDERTRLQALWLLREGWSVRDTTAAVGVHYRTVQRWMGDYRRGGVAAVLARHRGGHGQPRRLTADQEAALTAAAAQGQFRAAAQVRQWLMAQFGVTHGAGGIYSLLARLRLHPKVPRPTNPKAFPPAQTAWKKGG